MSLSTETRGQGRELVMLHGWGMNSAVWSDFADRLAVDYRVTLIDLPGHGNSPFDGEQGLVTWARACLEVAPEQAVWLGWSLGSMVALQAALMERALINGILIVAGMPRFVQAEAWPDAMPPQTLDLFSQALVDDHKKTLERFLVLQMIGSDQAVEILRRVKSRLHERPDPIPDALEAGLALLKTCDLREQLPTLSCPTRWLYGDRDTLAPSAASAVLQQWLPEATTHIVRGAAHTPFLSHPEESHQWVKRSLESIHG
ncbi:MAG: pimeloyl-ACP methyl ester esterase BioH [Candidatus Thiodiazotropha sp. (ex Ustalcina ferruginea)]|nr:pimeloyl-ACP methyl ester esterase BioH [Candidatus Thiodiazotropha sp. (ex Ustalcina ferruginea)]